MGRGKALQYLVGFVFISISAVVQYFILTRKIGDLDRIRYSDTIFTELLQKPRPALIKKSPAGKWRLSKKWTDDYLVQHLPSKLDVKMRNPSIFIHFDSSRTMTNYLGLKPNYKMKQLRPKKLLESIAKTPKRGLYYNDVVSQKMMEDLPNVNKFYFQSNTHEPMVKIWIGNKNVTANQHYDATHNFFHQVRGRKQFLLFPPNIFPSVKAFSSLHPSHRQSQEPKLESPMKVILKPGDVLYIPPFWFHHVTTLEPSISVNIWTNSEAVNDFQTCLKNPVPYLAPLEKANIVTDSNSNQFALQQFLRTLLHEFKDEIEAIKAALQFETIFVPFPCAQHDFPELFDEIITQHRRAASLSCFEPRSADVRVILLSSYLESVSALFIKPDRVRDFLHACIFF